MELHPQNASDGHIRRRARRAVQVVIVAAGLSGCYGSHGIAPVDATIALDAGPVVDGGVCVPDPDCSGSGEGGDGMCDWGQYRACCDEIGWGPEPCFLGGGPLSPPEMPDSSRYVGLLV